MKKKGSNTKTEKTTTPKKSEVLEQRKESKNEVIQVKDKKKKRKKHHPGLIIIGVLVFVLVGIPAIIAFGFIYDTSTKNVPTTEAQFTEVIDKAVAESFHQESLGEGKLELKFNKDMLDSTMMYVRNTLATSAPQAGKFIPKMYCIVNKSNYKFCVDLQASFFKTRLIIDTTIDSPDTSTIIHFKINNVFLGRLKIPAKWLNSIIGMFHINDDTINNMFKQSGVRMQCSLKTLELTYKREYFREDVGGLLNVDNNPFIKVLFSLIGDDEFLTTDYTDGIKATFNFMPDENKLNLSYNPKDNDTKIENHFINSNSMNTIAELLSGNYENEPESFQYVGDKINDNNAPAVFAYLFHGYTENAKDTINEINSNTKGFVLDCAKVFQQTCNDIESYEGAFIDENQTKQYKSICKENIEIKYIDKIPAEKQFNLFSIKETDMNCFFASLKNLIGTGIIFMTEENGEKYCDYIAIDNLYLKLKENSTDMNIYMNATIDGFPLCITIPATVNIDITKAEIETSTIVNLSLKINKEKILMGNVPIVSDIADTLLQSIGNNLSGNLTFENDEFKVTQEIDLDVKEILDHYTKETTIGLDEDGDISIILKVSKIQFKN